MIKINSKKTIFLLVVSGILVSAGTFAQNNPANSRKDQAVKNNTVSPGAGRSDNAGQNFCDRFSALADDLNQKVEQQRNRIQTRQEERFTNWASRSSEVDANLDMARDNWDENREEQFTALENRAQTEEQKKAVSEFEATVRVAVETRRAAVDAAMNTFREQVKNSIQTRQGQADESVSVFDSARLAAIEKAKTACGNGSDPVKVRTTLRTELKAAQDKLQGDRQNITKVSANIEAEIQTRRQAVQKAGNEFRATMEQARIKLKAAFANGSGTDMTTAD